MESIFHKLYYIMMFIILSSKACDKTFYIQQSNKLCDSEACSSSSVSLFQIKPFSVLCFQHPDGNTTKIELIQATEVISYKKLYRTCDYNIKTRIHRRCYYAGTCTSSSCVSSNKDDGGTFKASNTSTLAGRSGCSFTGTICPEYCGYNERSRCVWTDWELIVGTGDRCRTVLTQEYSTYSLKIRVIAGTSTSLYTLSPESPSLTSPFPISLASFISPQIDQGRLLTTAVYIDSATVLRISASPLNQPSIDNIGDLQVPLTGNSNPIFPIHTVSCDYSTCYPTCHVPMSSLRRLILDTELYDHYPSDDVFTAVYVGGRTIAKKSITGLLTLFYEMPEIDSLYVTHARCSFQVTHVIGCTGCSAPSRVGLQPVDVKTPGLVNMESNCSITQPYLVCQKEALEIEISGTPSYCRIDLIFTESLDQTLAKLRRKTNDSTKQDSLRESFVIAMHYDFLGGTLMINQMDALPEESSVAEGLYMAWTNDYFKWSLAVGFGLTTILILVSRVIAIYLVFRASQKAAKDLSDSR